ncbi:Histone deacetylase hdt1 [Stylosanthes scabra]|uniref:Histone deacetylase hdt1 n=1 Tax=Stylosanthes scabra TaxID=79078 RepID=A0ABU6U3V6_9FABA|nr:Histone deacetylase hdt1 [Stylosanthes scabra]
MEFWGVEVKPGDSVKIDQLEVFNAYIHISQVALGEAAKNEKSNDPVVIYLKVGEQKLVIGTLNRVEIPQIPLDLVLDQEAELSHTGKSASVYFTGYRADRDEGGPGEFDSDDFSESDEEEAALNVKDNGKLETKNEKVKIAEPKKDVSAVAAKKPNVAVPKKDEEDEDSDEDDSDEDDDSDDEDESGSEMDADSDDESDDDEEETPVKKVDQGKKRPNTPASKTPVPSAKKAKNVTPEKSGGKKNAHTPTPHPAKKGGNPNSAGKFQSLKTGSQQQKKSAGKKGGR